MPFSTTKVTVAACQRYLLAYRSKGERDAGQFTGASSRGDLKSLISQMEEIVGSGQERSLNGPGADMLFAGGLFFS